VTIDCTPMLTRLTPAAAKVSIIGPVTLSGLHSTLTSAPADTGTAARMRAMYAGSISVGVPPPRKTVSAGGIPAATLCPMSATTASTYSSTMCPRSVHVANAQ